jgi:hypothetical protein
MGWNWPSLCGIFVTTLCLCGHTYDMLKLNLMGILACNLNLVYAMLIINELSVGAFLLTSLYPIAPCYYLTYHLCPALAEYQP